MDIQNEFGSRDVAGSSCPPPASTTHQTESHQLGAGAGQSHSGSSKVGEKTRQTTAKARDQAKRAASQATEKVQETAQQAQEQGRRFFQQQQSQLSERISHYGHSAHSVAEKLRQEDDPTLAEYTDTLADQFDRVSGYLRERDLQGLFEDTQAAIRRRPEIFFGGMFVAGMAIARFLKASGSPRRHRYDHRTSEAWERDDITEGGLEDYPSEWQSELSGAGAVGATHGGMGAAPLNPGAATPASGPELSSMGSRAPSPAGPMKPATSGMEHHPVTETGTQADRPEDASVSKGDPTRNRPSSS